MGAFLYIRLSFHDLLMVQHNRCDREVSLGVLEAFAILAPLQILEAKKSAGQQDQP